MKKATITQQIERLEQHIEAEKWDAAREQIDALHARKLTKAQAEHLDALSADIPEEGKPSQSKQLSKYKERYVTCVTSSGNSSLNNGDKIAQFLEGKSAIEVMRLADEHTPIKGGQTHADKYSRLNEGSKRMNAGNKLRAAARRGDWNPA